MRELTRESKLSQLFLNLTQHKPKVEYFSYWSICVLQIHQVRLITHSSAFARGEQLDFFPDRFLSYFFCFHTLKNWVNSNLKVNERNMVLHSFEYPLMIIFRKYPWRWFPHFLIKLTRVENPFAFGHLGLFWTLKQKFFPIKPNVISVGKSKIIIIVVPARATPSLIIFKILLLFTCDWCKISLFFQWKTLKAVWNECLGRLLNIRWHFFVYVFKYSWW